MNQAGWSSPVLVGHRELLKKLWVELKERYGTREVGNMEGRATYPYKFMPSD